MGAAERFPPPSGLPATENGAHTPDRDQHIVATKKDDLRRRQNLGMRAKRQLAREASQALVGDQRVVYELARGNTVDGTAAASGLSRSTVERRAHDPRILAEVDALRRAMISELSLALADSASEALQLTRDVVNDESLSVTLRLRAAAQLLSSAARFSEISEARELRERLVALEKQLAIEGSFRPSTSMLRGA